jgi:quercetin dioxygenase-like cupin family protein
MTMKSESVRACLRSLAVAGLIAGAMSVLSSAAFAGECPADKVVADGKGQTAGATEPKDVTDNVLASIDLSKEMIAANDHLFRMRRLVIQPGGIVPWHNHADRPAIIYIVDGTITEYASTCAVPIVHQAGEVSVDAGRSHWWKNTGSKPVVLISSDILHDPKEAGMM